MPLAAAIIPAAIGAGTSIFGAAKGASASQNAAATQAASAKQAQDFIQQLLDKYNPQIGDAAKQAAGLSTDAGASAVQNMRDTLAQNRSDVLGGVGAANALLDPYASMGAGAAKQLADLMAPGGALSQIDQHQFNFQDIQNLDPGYQFRMDQASKALQSGAAARGGALSGGAQVALANLNQNMASAEAQNAFQRLQAQQAFRAQQQQNLFGRYQSMVGTGLAASGQQGSNIMGGNEFVANQGFGGAQNIGNWMIQPAQFAGSALMQGAESQANNAMNAGRSIADLITGAGNARASGTMGAANAWSGGLSGVSNAVGGLGRYFTDQQLLKILKNPAGGGDQEI